MLKRLSGQGDMQVTLLASLPYMAGFLTQQLNGWHSDRTRERRWHAAIPVLLSGLGLFFAIGSGTQVALSIIFSPWLVARITDSIPVRPGHIGDRTYRLHR